MHSTLANRAAPWCRLVAICGLLGIQAVHGQSPAEPPVPTAPPVPKVYTKNKVFRLPVQLSNEERAQLRELKFYVKPLPGPWTCQETAPPSQTSFVYQATADGEYWFNFTTTDKAGRVAPENLDDEVPGLIVVVDTTPPQVDVYPIAVSGGEVMLQCQVRDVAPDLATLKLEYLSPEKRWIALTPYQPNTPELFRVPDPNILSGKVRVTVADRAGNVCSREIDLSLAGVIPPEVARTAQATVRTTPVPLPHPPAREPGVQLAQATESAQPSIERTTHRVDASQAALPSPPGAAGSGQALTPPAPAKTSPPAAAPAKTTPQLINSRRLKLDYAIESAIRPGSKVEFWGTPNGGQTWLLISEDADCTSPAQLVLPQDGTWGLLVVVVPAGMSGGKSPTATDQPDWLVEIDSTPPSVSLTSASVQPGDSGPMLHLGISVTERHLGETPVSVYWSSESAGPWQVLAENLANEPLLKLPLPPTLPARGWLKVVVRDRAGNTGQAQTSEAVDLHLPRPRARVLGVSAVEMP